MQDSTWRFQTDDPAVPQASLTLQGTAGAVLSGAAAMPRTANIPCADCDRMFTSETTLAMHRANKHKPGQTATPPVPKSRPPAATTPAAADDDDDGDIMDMF